MMGKIKMQTKATERMRTVQRKCIELINITKESTLGMIHDNESEVKAEAEAELEVEVKIGIGIGHEGAIGVPRQDLDLEVDLDRGAGIVDGLIAERGITGVGEIIGDAAAVVRAQIMEKEGGTVEIDLVIK